MLELIAEITFFITSSWVRPSSRALARSTSITYSGIVDPLHDAGVDDAVHVHDRLSGCSPRSGGTASGLCPMTWMLIGVVRPSLSAVLTSPPASNANSRSKNRGSSCKHLSQPTNVVLRGALVVRGELNLHQGIHRSGIGREGRGPAGPNADLADQQLQIVADGLLDRRLPRRRLAASVAVSREPLRARTKISKAPESTSGKNSRRKWLPSPSSKTDQQHHRDDDRQQPMHASTQSSLRPYQRDRIVDELLPPREKSPLR